METGMIPNKFTGKFIVFEGLDGCGKTTQLLKTYIWLSNLKLSVIKTKEPDKNSDWGSKIYEELRKPDGLHKDYPFGFQTLYASNSKVHLQKIIIPKLKSSHIVLSDRYRPSMCYGAQKPDEIQELMEMNQRIIGQDFIWPDATLIFDVSPEVGIARLKQKCVRPDEFEMIEIQRKVRRNYLYFYSRYENCYLIDGELPLDVVFLRVKEILSKVLHLDQIK